MRDARRRAAGSRRHGNGRRDHVRHEGAQTHHVPVAVRVDAVGEEDHERPGARIDPQRGPGEARMAEDPGREGSPGRRVASPCRIRGTRVSVSVEAGPRERLDAERRGPPSRASRRRGSCGRTSRDRPRSRRGQRVPRRRRRRRRGGRAPLPASSVPPFARWGRHERRVRRKSRADGNPSPSSRAAGRSARVRTGRAAGPKPAGRSSRGSRNRRRSRRTPCRCGSQRLPVLAGEDLLGEPVYKSSGSSGAKPARCVSSCSIVSSNAPRPRGEVRDIARTGPPADFPSSTGSGSRAPSPRLSSGRHPLR